MGGRGFYWVWTGEGVRGSFLTCRDLLAQVASISLSLSNRSLSLSLSFLSVFSVVQQIRGGGGFLYTYI